MKLTKEKLKQIIREELENVIDADYSKEEDLFYRVEREFEKDEEWHDKDGVLKVELGMAAYSVDLGEDALLDAYHQFQKKVEASGEWPDMSMRLGLKSEMARDGKEYTYLTFSPPEWT